jgi:membrane protease YdiL (CAAX protease family)
LQERPIVGSVIITVLAGLLLQMSNIIGIQERLDSVLPDYYLTVRLIDFGFRMTMGAILVLVAIPLLLGYMRTSGWLSEHLRLMRVSTGISSRKTISAATLSLLAFILIVVGLSLGQGVFSADLGVLVDDDNWLILLAALIPGIWEELAFRGVVLSSLQRRFSPRTALVLSSVLFGLFHFSNLLTWEDAGSVVAGVIAATALGIGWGYVAIKTNSVMPAIFLHYVVDVVLFDQLFVDPLATDDSTSIIYLGIAVLYPALTILITRRLFWTNQPARARTQTSD